MPTIFINTNGNTEFLSELEQSLKEKGLQVNRPAQMRSFPISTEIIVALGSAGAFSAFFQVISNYLLKNKDREIHIKSGDKEITLKGHSLLEEKEIIKSIMSGKIDE